MPNIMRWVQRSFTLIGIFFLNLEYIISVHKYGE